MYYDQAQSWQHPKRGTASTQACTTIKHNPASIRNEAQPVLNMYYNHSSSRQHPKRGTASTRLVLRSSTIQPASETRHSQYSTCTTIIHQRGQHPKRSTASTQRVLQSFIIHHPGSIRQDAQPVLSLSRIKHNPASIRNEAQPVLSLNYDQAQSSQHPKRGRASTKLVLRSSTIQPASETRHSQYSTCTTIIHHSGSQ